MKLLVLGPTAGLKFFSSEEKESSESEATKAMIPIALQSGIVRSFEEGQKPTVNGDLRMPPEATNCTFNSAGKLITAVCPECGTPNIPIYPTRITFGGPVQYMCLHCRGHLRAVNNRKTRAQASVLPKRNDPCFCGSGKKYKKCCLPRL